jgi:hypothetical protein
MSRYPARVTTTAYGLGLIATAALGPGTIVARFEGPVVTRDDVPAEEAAHALWVEGDQWLLPRSDARYANHSCAPNCRVDDDLNLVTIRAVNRGTELTISYNTVSRAEWEAYRRHPEHYAWDRRWSFDCQCGAVNCVGRIDGYRVRGEHHEPLEPWPPAIAPAGGPDLLA